MKIDELMEELAATAETAPIVGDENNVYRIDLDGHVVAFSQAAEEGEVMIWAEVGRSPEKGAGAFYRKLLEAMFLDSGTDGSTFSVDAETGRIYLARKLEPTALTLERFCQAIESFGVTLIKWFEAGRDFESPAAETSSGGEVPGGGIRV